MTPTTASRAGRTGALILSLGLAFAACSSGAAPATSSPSGSPPAASASPSDAAGEGREPGDVGTLPPDTPVGGGVDPGAGGGAQPGAGQPQVVQPKPGTLNPREVPISTLAARVEGRQVLLNARWWSGVEPCSVLDRIGVAREGDTFTIALFEGSGDGDAICIEIALEKLTVIDLGELGPGTYTIEASTGDAAPISVVVG